MCLKNRANSLFLPPSTYSLYFFVCIVDIEKFKTSNSPRAVCLKNQNLFFWCYIKKLKREDFSCLLSISSKPLNVRRNKVVTTRLIHLTRVRLRSSCDRTLKRWGLHNKHVWQPPNNQKMSVWTLLLRSVFSFFLFFFNLWQIAATTRHKLHINEREYTTRGEGTLFSIYITLNF